IIIHAANPNELSEEVKQYLKEGWIVLGAPFSHAGEGGTEVCQALLKPDSIRPGSIGFNR
ncbi:MAG: DUF1737 domain-containing protein, partial [Flavisolibacter sp.]